MCVVCTPTSCNTSTTQLPHTPPSPPSLPLALGNAQVRELERFLPPGPSGRRASSSAHLGPHTTRGLAPAAAVNAWLAGQGGLRTPAVAAPAGTWGRPWEGASPALEATPGGAGAAPGPLERMAAALEEALAAAVATPTSSHPPAPGTTQALPAAAAAGAALAPPSAVYQTATPGERSSSNGAGASQQQVGGGCGFKVYICTAGRTAQTNTQHNQPQHQQVLCVWRGGAL